MTEYVLTASADLSIAKSVNKDTAARFELLRTTIDIFREAQSGFFASNRDIIQELAGDLQDVHASDIDEVILAKKIQRFYGPICEGPLGGYAIGDNYEQVIRNMTLEQFLGGFATIRYVLQQDPRIPPHLRQEMEAKYNEISATAALYRNIPAVRSDLPDLLANSAQLYRANRAMLMTGTPEKFHNDLKQSLTAIGIPEQMPVLLKPDHVFGLKFNHKHLPHWKAAAAANLSAELPGRNIFVLDDVAAISQVINLLRTHHSPGFERVFAIEMKSPQMWDHLRAEMDHQLAFAPGILAREL